MTRFVFRLQPLLEQKVEAREQAERALGERLSELAEAEREMERLKVLEAAAQQRAIQGRENLINAPTCQGMHLVRLRDRLKVLVSEHDEARENALAFRVTLEACQRAVQSARRSLSEARREEEVLMKYREKQEKRFLQEYEQKQAAEMDEAANVAFLNRRMRS